MPVSTGIFLSGMVNNKVYRKPKDLNDIHGQYKKGKHKGHHQCQPGPVSGNGKKQQGGRNKKQYPV